MLPEFHRVVVDVEGWMTSAEFADLFALAQLAPGPQRDGRVAARLEGGRRLAGAFVATVAACGPSSVACYFAWRWADRLRESHLRALMQRALAPVAIGLILASGYTLAQGADRSPGALVLTAVATAAIAFTRVNPVWMLARGGASPASAGSRDAARVFGFGLAFEHRAAAARRCRSGTRSTRAAARRARPGTFSL